MAFDISAPISMPQLIERATTSMLVAPDWTINIQICDMCGRDPMLAKEAAALVKKKIKGSSTTSAVFALHLLEALMKNAWYVIPHVHAKEYLATLVRIVKDKKTKYQLRDKLADLIQSWGLGFQSSTRFPDFFMTYQSLKHAGIRFHPPQNDYVEPTPPAGARRSRAPIPPVSSSAYRVSTGAGATGGSPSGQRRVYVDQYGQRYVASTAPPRAITSHEASLYGMSSSPSRETKGQRTIRIRNQFDPMKTKIQLLEEMLNSTPPSELYSSEIISEIWPSCRSYLQDLNHWIEEGNMDEVLLAELLSVHDQMTNIEKKYEEMARLASMAPGASEFTPSLILDIDGPSSSSSPSSRHPYAFADSDDDSDLALPPPPGQRTPPLLLDGFVNRPLTSPTAIPPVSSLEEFLSLPPISSSATTSVTSSSTSPFLGTATSSSSSAATASTSSPSFFLSTSSIPSPLPTSAPVSFPASFASPAGSFASPSVYAGIPLQSGAPNNMSFSQIPVGLNPSTFTPSTPLTSSAPSFSATPAATPLTADIFSNFTAAPTFAPTAQASSPFTTSSPSPSPLTSSSPMFPTSTIAPLDPSQLTFPSATPLTTSGSAATQQSLFPTAPSTTPSPFTTQPSASPITFPSSQPTTPFNPWASQTSPTTTTPSPITFPSSQPATPFNPFGL